MVEELDALHIPHIGSGVSCISFALQFWSTVIQLTETEVHDLFHFLLILLLTLILLLIFLLILIVFFCYFSCCYSLLHIPTGDGRRTAETWLYSLQNVVFFLKTKSPKLLLLLRKVFYGVLLVKQGIPVAMADGMLMSIQANSPQGLIIVPLSCHPFLCPDPKIGGHGMHAN